MCLSTPTPPPDTSAQQAQVQADQRQAQITQGQGDIDSAFSQFDPNYYSKYTQAYQDNYNPQVDQQFQIAQQKERYNAARVGTLDSTPAIHADDLLNQNYGQQKQQVSANALNATNDLQNSVQSQKSQLYADNSAAADPTLASSQAAAAAGTIPSTPQYSVLGDLFSGLVNAGAGAAAGAAKSLPPGYSSYFQPGQGLPGGNGGSGSVVG